AGSVRPAGGTVDDPERIAYLRDHLVAAHQAISAGVRLEGYHLWSLLDNFEWAQGYTQRWGVVHVDFDTQVRTLKRSAHWYRDVTPPNAVLAAGPAGARSGIDRVRPVLSPLDAIPRPGRPRAV